MIAKMDEVNKALDEAITAWIKLSDEWEKIGQSIQTDLQKSIRLLKILEK